ncbi:hypothetical protein [Curtobacterium sp. VKM Ac-2922]|uniref:hypothetical protein n=1 Tax=Curtobacterium sp. VKM Ac-2922 TaxID=2929475 RepID=UPI001FB2BFC1|nr:hypothetical protein [Curtobacterium sp. VKM Ac-2922]MCJ1713511.1 hypothetical protein [Curtobacterium sp. VKM Ac-2922]
MPSPFVSASTAWLAAGEIGVALLLVVLAVVVGRSVRATDPTHRVLRAWYRRRLVALAIGIAVGTGVSVVYVWGTGADRGRAVPDLLLVGAVVGAAGFGALAGLGLRSHHVGDQRVASAVALPARDLTPRRMRRAALIAVLAAVGLSGWTVLAMVTSPRFSGLQPVPSPALLLTMVAVLVLVSSLVTAKVVAGTPQRAADEAELQTRDLVRRLVAQDASAAAIATGVAAALLTVPELISALDVPFIGPGAFAAVTWTVTSLAAAVLVVVAFPRVRAVRSAPQ